MEHNGSYTPARVHNNGRLEEEHVTSIEVHIPELCIHVTIFSTIQ